ncbi:ABC transporter permease [Blattabacterium cuenoti]|uniref:ABC transporter permease n=1 Tax=Blattabacterium cuenoti TaxID=1653831 RepID=UPI00163C6E34|nr:ABC transporter permease [Blattabacterium cuenoti]
MKTSFDIAIRYFFSKKKVNVVNIILFLSTVSLSVSTFVLSIILSVFSGLEDLNKKFYQTHYSDITISSFHGKEIDMNENFLRKKMKSVKGIMSFSKTIEKKVFFHYKNTVFFFPLKGVDNEYEKVMKNFKIFFLEKKNRKTTEEKNKINLYIGLSSPIIHYFPFFFFREREKQFFPSVTIQLLTFIKKSHKISIPFFIQKKAIIKGFFQFNQNTDKKYLFCNLSDIQNIINKNVFHTLEIKICQNENISTIKKILKKKFGSQFMIKTREEEEKAFYKVVNSEKLFIYFLFSLITLITGFNLISAIYILKLDKENQLFVLWSLGYSLSKIKRIFLSIGILITIFGWMFGIFISYIVSFLQKKYHLLKIVEDIPFPVKFTIENFCVITCVIFTVGVIVSFFSCRKIGIRII